jgi:hypothetical protein
MLTRYDQMNGRELKAELTRRFGTNSGLKNKPLPINRNQAGYKYRVLFIQDDLKNGINPYHNSSSPSDDDSLVPPQSPLTSLPSLPSAS